MSGFSFYTYNAEKNFFGGQPLPNVLLSASCARQLDKDGARGQLQTNVWMYELIQRLNKPNWKFVFDRVMENSDLRIALDFHITCDDEQLGMVEMEYKGRGIKIRVTNKRLDANRKRGSGYFTDSIDRAVLAIRKNFYPRAAAERVNDAKNMVESLLATERMDKHSNNEREWQHVFGHARDFVRANMDSYLAAYPNLKARVSRATETQLAMETVKDIESKFLKGSYLLVIQTGSDYIVKSKDEVHICTDALLNEETKSKLGMLKLVDKGQMISDVGCRADTEVFLIVQDQEQKQQ